VQKRGGKPCHRAGLFSGEDLIGARKLEPIPSIHQGLCKAIDQRIIVVRRRRDPQPLKAARNRRIVDRLDIDAVFPQQQIARHLALFGISDMDRNDVGVARHQRKLRAIEHQF